MLSDGECDEGSIWEAAMFAGHHKLSNLFALVDYNKLQSLMSTDSTLTLEPFTDKWRAFGWEVMEVDGHDHDQIRAALTAPPADKPRCMLAHTTKGKGVSFMENQVVWHYKPPSADELALALEEVEA
jgi:transketolase